MFHRGMPLALALAGLLAQPLPALSAQNDDLKELRKQIEQLKQDYEARIQRLEARLQQTECRPCDRNAGQRASGRDGE